MTERPPEDDDDASTEQPLSPADSSLLADELFDLLSDRRRLYALTCLAEHDTPLSLPDLADEVAVREHDTPITDISAEEVKRVYASLWHSHVPKLEDARIIVYDQDRDMVSLGERFTRIEPVLALAESEL